jgi:regulator of protease activity HflC (stomatin/prohibitin superfamily)
MGIFLLVIVTFVIIFAIKGFKIVQQAETIVVERLGKYSRTLSPGVNIIWPIFDKPRLIEFKEMEECLDGRTILRKKKKEKIDLRETVYDFPKQDVITEDNVAMEVNGLLYYQITDPVRAVYEIYNLVDGVEKLTQTTLRNVIGELTLDETLTSRDTINQRLRKILDEATDKWGVKVNRVEVKDITPPDAVKTAMEQQMRAERDRRAAILKAEGVKQSKVLESEGARQAEINAAEGVKQALVLRASGEAEARMKVAQGEANAVESVTKAIVDAGGNPTSYLIALKYIDTMREMVSGQENKIVYMPYEATAMLGSVGSIREMFASGMQPKT